MDITKCTNETCPKKASCYRYLAEVNPYYQSYARFEFDEVSDSCEYFSDIKDRQIEISLIPIPIVKEFLDSLKLD